jgi:hypothetical protein
MIDPNPVNIRAMAPTSRRIAFSLDMHNAPLDSTLTARAALSHPDGPKALNPMSERHRIRWGCAAMSTKTALKILFSCIFLSLLVCSIQAGIRQPILQWGGLRGADRYWTMATLMDAYFGFVTFYVWVFFKEPRWISRLAWFIGIMLLGNMAMSAYVLLQLARLTPDQDASAILAPANRRPSA